MAHHAPTASVVSLVALRTPLLGVYPSSGVGCTCIPAMTSAHQRVLMTQLPDV